MPPDGSLTLRPQEVTFASSTRSWPDRPMWSYFITILHIAYVAGFIYRVLVLQVLQKLRRFRYRVLFRFSDQYRFHKVSSVMVHYICIGWPLMFLWLVVRFPSRRLQQHSLSVCCCCVLFVAVAVCPTALRDGRIFGISIIIGLQHRHRLTLDTSAHCLV